MANHAKGWNILNNRKQRKTNKETYRNRFKKKLYTFTMPTKFDK